MFQHLVARMEKEWQGRDFGDELELYQQQLTAAKALSKAVALKWLKIVDRVESQGKDIKARMELVLVDRRRQPPTIPRHSSIRARANRPCRSYSGRMGAVGSMDHAQVSSCPAESAASVGHAPHPSGGPKTPKLLPLAG